MQMNSMPIEILHGFFECDASKGTLVRKVLAGNQRPGTVPGKLDKLGYRYVIIQGKGYFAHRIIWAMHFGEWPKGIIDHIDGDPKNNAIANLRVIDMAANGKNIGLAMNNKTGVTGVIWVEKDGRWEARISSEKKNIYLGRHPTIFEAVAARRSAEIRYGFHKNHGMRPSLKLKDCGHSRDWRTA